MNPHEKLLAAARDYLVAFYPGYPLKSVKLRVYGLDTAIVLAVAPGIPASGEEEEDEPRTGRERFGLDACTRDILACLEAAGRPLSKTRLIEAMDRRARERLGGEWSESTICRRLAELMSDGTISNPEGLSPRGYRLAE